MMQETRAASRRKKKMPLPIILIVVILFVGILTALAVIQPWKPAQPFVVMSGDGNLFSSDGEAQAGALPDMTEEELEKQMQQIADASMFSYKINATPEFENGDSPGILSIENPNYNVYPIAVDIVLDQTKEKIYASGGILPNQHIYEAKLSKALAKGTYPATAVITIFDPETKKQVGVTEAGLTIIVHN